MRNEKGFTLIELLVVILIIGILIMMIIPNFVLFQDRARQSNVKTAMHTVRIVLEAYSVDHYGVFPPAEAYSWGLDYAPGDETDPGDPVTYFGGGTPFATPDAGIAGIMPRNPYNGFPYNNGDVGIENLVYCFDDVIGIEDGTSWDDDVRNVEVGASLYDGFELEDGTFAGSIYILPGTATGDAGESVTNYGVCGFGKYMEGGTPMYNAIADPTDPATMLFSYYVLTN